METGGAILFVGVLVFVAHMLVELFKRTRIPDVFFLILIGFVIGPVFHLVAPEDFGKVGPIFKTVALVVILFEGGLAIRLEDLRSALRGTLFITVGSFLIAAVFLTAGVRYLSDLSWGMCVFVGVLLAGPAPSVVIPLMEHLGLKSEARTTLTLESALGEGLCIVVALAVVSSFVGGNLHTGQVIGQIIASVTLALVIGAGAGYLWSLLLNKTRRLQHAIFLTPSFVFIIYGLAQELGYSGAMAVLAFSVMVENVELLDLPRVHKKIKLEPIVLNNREKQFFGEIVFLLKTFFFVFLGLSIRLGDVRAVEVASLLALVLLVSRLISVRCCVARDSATCRDASLMAVMIPRGLAAAVLASAPLYAGIAGGAEVETMVNSVIAVSIVYTTVLIFLLERTAVGKLAGWLFSRYAVSSAEPAAAEKAKS